MVRCPAGSSHFFASRRESPGRRDAKAFQYGATSREDIAVGYRRLFMIFPYLFADVALRAQPLCRWSPSLGLRKERRFWHQGDTAWPRAQEEGGY